MTQFHTGKYRSIKKLGGGGMANVYLAKDTETGAKVALKVSRKSVPYAREALQNEYGVYQRLDHDCFPKVMELIEDDDRLVLVMEYLEGETLEERLQRETPAADVALKLVRKIAEAMVHAGERGVIHADLKPANVLIHNDAIKIIDFGLASGASTLTAEDIKEIAGTLNYFSPEQADGRPLDIRSDVFSVGVILYELLTGKRPFESGYDMATIYSIMYEEPVPPSKLEPTLGSIVDKLVSGMLEKQPEERYTDFGAVCDAIDAIGEHFDVGVQNPTITVTVAPFQMRQSPDDELFAEGVTEELISLMSRLDGVDVTPFVVIKRAFTEERTPEEVRSEFGADFLLSGSIRRAASRIRVSATLMETQSSKIVWTERYDSPVTDIFDLQDLICEQITDALRLEFAPCAERGKAARATKNVEAYEFYLKGRSYLTRNTREDMEFARTMLEKAIEIDPKYPLAYAGLADLHGSLYMNYFDRSRANWEKGIALAQKAIDLDPSKPNGYRAYGRLLHLHGKYDEAIEYLSRAVTLDANYGEAYRTLAWANEGKGALQESLAWTRKALSVDPLSEETILLQGMLYYDLNSMPQAINACTRCLELRPDYGRAHYYLARSFQKVGRFDEALSKYAIASRYGGQPEIYLDYGWLLYCRGDTERAIEVLTDACENNQQIHLAHCYLALALDGLCRDDEAAEHFTGARDISQRLMQQSENTVYSAIVYAISTQALGNKREADESFHKVTRAPETDGNGELALLCARYCARRQWKRETEKWLTNALTWRLGFSELEALIDPLFNDYRDFIKSVAASSAA